VTTKEPDRARELFAADPLATTQVTAVDAWLAAQTRPHRRGAP
jgi:hypothetical protein